MKRGKSSGHFKRPSLEVNCLTARGEDAIGFYQEPSFGACSRENSSNLHGEGSSTCNFSFTLNSSRASFSSPSKIPTASPSMESPLSRVASAQIRARMRGRHIRAASRSFAHETIHEMQEELYHETPHGTLIESPSLGLTTLQLTTPTTDLFRGKDRYMKGTRRTLESCYALKHEAELTVTESKQEWVDTSYSIAIVQNFNPPKDVESMKTLLQDSMKTYRPLPSELRAHRRRNSRNLMSSPYAQSRLSSASISSIMSPRKGSMARSKRNSVMMEDPASPGTFSSPCASVMLPNASSNCNPSASRNETRIKPFTPRDIKSTVDGLGFLKQETPKLKSRSRQLQTPGKGHDRKNKENVSQEMLKTPGGSLKIDRPRPRYRTPTPGPKRRPAKI